MNAPSLDQLRDIHLPPPPTRFPLTTDEFALIGALVLAAGVLWLLRRRRLRPLRAALDEVERIERAHAGQPDDLALARGLSGVLRRYARWRYPATSVAGLSGEAWLAFLDARGGAGAFSSGPGAVLASLPYAPPATVETGTALDASTLADLVRRWLRENAP